MKALPPMTDELFPNLPPVLGVSELTRRIRGLLDQGIGEVWVEGEISNHRLQSSGHQYFTLKDSRAQLACVLFARAAGKLKLTDGMAIQVFGQITVYEARGQYQMIVELAQPRGLGLLQAKFEALKRKLDAEGLFDPARKRRIPRFPSRIGMVTSPSGAALQDMINVLTRRAPWVRVLLHPVRVQGAGAALEIASAIHDFSENYATGPGKLDLIIVARGGGSLEDLWPFNEETVARAIFHSALPVVSAVGHEIDFSIADFVADLRAPTPSAAAELVTPDGVELGRRLDHFSNRFHHILRAKLSREEQHLTVHLLPALLRESIRQLNQTRQRLDLTAEGCREVVERCLASLRQRQMAAASSLHRHRPDQVLALKRQALVQMRSRLQEGSVRQLLARRHLLARQTGLLRVLGPAATLERGYTITAGRDGTVLTKAADAKSGDLLKTRFQDGEVTSVATD